MRFNLRGRYFRRMLASAAVLILIPLIGGVLVYLGAQRSQLMDGAAAEYEKGIARQVSAADQQFENVTRFASMLAADEKIDGLLRSAFNPIESADIRTQLGIYRNSNDFFEEIYLYVPAHGIVYTSRMLLPDANDLIGARVDGAYWRDAMLDEKAMYAFVRRVLVLPGFRRSADGSEKILYTAPVFKRGDALSMTVTVAVNANRLRGLLVDRLETGGDTPFTCLLGRDGAPIYLSSDRFGAEDLLAALENGTPLRAEGLAFRAFETDSSLYGYRYLFAIPERALYAGMLYPIPFALTIIFLSLAFAACALALFLRANYAPIHDVYKLARKYEGDGGADEIDSIRDTIGLLEDRIASLDTQLDDGRRARLRGFLFDLMNGSAGARAAQDAQAAAFGIPSDCAYCAALIACANPDALSRRLKPIALFSAGLVEGDYNCCLFCLPRTMDDEALRAALQSAAETLRREGLDTPGACAGSLCAALADLPYSYIEAKAAAELQHMMGRGIVMYKDVSMLMPARSGPRHALPDCVALARSVAQRDAAGIRAYIDEVAQLFEGCDMPMVETRRMLFDIHNAVHSVAPEAIGQITTLRELFELRTQDEAVEMLRLIERELLSFGQPARAAARPDLSEVVAFIQAHCMEHDFTIRIAAARAGVSFPYFSQLFKQDMGLSPMDYVTGLRMRSAQDLLLHTELSVSEIVDRVGYYSVSSFIKRFRQYCGMTPGEYRGRGEGAEEARAKAPTP